MPIKQFKGPEQKKAGIVTLPLSGTGINNLQNFIATLKPLVSELHVISGGIPTDRWDSSKIRIVNVNPRRAWSFASRALNNFLTQLQITIQLNKRLKKIDFLFFHIGYPMLVLPILLAKLKKKKVAIIATGNPAASTKFKIPFSSLKLPI